LQGAAAFASTAWLVSHVLAILGFVLLLCVHQLRRLGVGRALPAGLQPARVPRGDEGVSTQHDDITAPIPEGRRVEHLCGLTKSHFGRIWLGQLPWISFVLMVGTLFATLPPSGEFGPGLIVGWLNRLLFLTWYAWLMVMAWQVIRANSQCSA
jgi:hypothetical protein